MDVLGPLTSLSVAVSCGEFRLFYGICPKVWENAKNNKTGIICSALCACHDDDGWGKHKENDGDVVTIYYVGERQKMYVCCELLPEPHESTGKALVVELSLRLDLNRGMTRSTRTIKFEEIGFRDDLSAIYMMAMDGCKSAGLCGCALFIFNSA